MSQSFDPSLESRSGSASEEVDVWWGGYSMRALMPEVAFTGLLTALLVACWWFLLPHDWLWLLHLAVMPSAALLWLAQGLRWAHRCFGRAYRLTNRRLYEQRGFDNTKAVRLSLEDILAVNVRQTWLEKRLGYGRIVVKGKTGKDLLLEGVRRPKAAARLIRHVCEAGQ